jgi:hypothetical protein
MVCSLAGVPNQAIPPKIEVDPAVNPQPGARHGNLRGRRGKAEGELFGGQASPLKLRYDGVPEVAERRHLAGGGRPKDQLQRVELQVLEDVGGTGDEGGTVADQRMAWRRS